MLSLARCEIFLVISGHRFLVRAGDYASLIIDNLLAYCVKNVDELLSVKRSRRQETYAFEEIALYLLVLCLREVLPESNLNFLLILIVIDEELHRVHQEGGYELP